MICPNCGSTLTYADGLRQCTSCEYQITFNEIDYSKQHSRLCMICGDILSDDELQICDKCKDKMLLSWRKQNDNN